MGIYLNPGNIMFQKSLRKEIYVDKSEMISNLNKMIDFGEPYVCVSRPRRFGKSVDANMLVAYYSKECDSHLLFDHLKISRHESYEKHLNQHHVIHLNMNNFLTSSSNVQEMIRLIEKYIMMELKLVYQNIVFDQILSMFLQSVYSSTKEG